MRRVAVHSRRRLLDDFFKVDELMLDVEGDDGTQSPPLRRLVFERGDSVAATVRHRESGDLLFTEQLRAPAIAKAGGWLVEVMAGMIEDGESPEEALHRELLEELGYRVDAFEKIATFFVSPGGSSERIWLYHVEVSDNGRVSAGGGLASEREDIRIVRMRPDEARDALLQRRWMDAKTIIGLQWLLARTGWTSPVGPAQR
ncbi:NUDIX hydrolase [Variovorax sp. J22P240]|uniref:NUDIX domain-containing protein n=1 Tax=Variovorax sp. J22P240 TaxID=3053514 RepID=UPI00257863E1|nr:NUDIX hydrolase [Variovorax sp. J22P240]MDM0002802.1 NUDIX hydrolase [Variovorax sp. J22P240]